MARGRCCGLDRGRVRVDQVEEQVADSDPEILHFSFSCICLHFPMPGINATGTGGTGR